MTGIDLSHYQDGLDLGNMSGYSFAILKISEGKGLADSSFEKFYAAAAANKIPVGAYVYSHALTPDAARAEANFALSRLNGRPLQLGIYMDVETTGQMQLPKAQLKETVTAFVETVKAAGYHAGIYGSEYNAWSRLSVDEFEEFLIWVAHYGKSPDIPCDLWQMTDKGSFPNYYGYVDVDEVRSSRFAELVEQKKEEPKFPPDPSVAILQMVMKYNGYWDYEIDGRKTTLFFQKLEEFVHDMRLC